MPLYGDTKQGATWTTLYRGSLWECLDDCEVRITVCWKERAWEKADGPRGLASILRQHTKVIGLVKATSTGDKFDPQYTQIDSRQLYRAKL